MSSCYQIRANLWTSIRWWRWLPIETARRTSHASAVLVKERMACLFNSQEDHQATKTANDGCLRLTSSLDSFSHLSRSAPPGLPLRGNPVSHTLVGCITTHWCWCCKALQKMLTFYTPHKTYRPLYQVHLNKIWKKNCTAKSFLLLVQKTKVKQRST